MVVQHNLSAMNANRMLGITQGTLSKSTEKLSSGYKVNRAADDAAGLSISEKMRKQIRGLSQASLNAEDGISAVQTAEGALAEVHDMLQRMNELAVKAANGTNSENDRNYIQDEIDQLVTEIDRVAETTKFNETYLLKGDSTLEKGNSLVYQAEQTGVTAEATFTADAATGATVEFTATAHDADPNISNSEMNSLVKSMKNLGVTITTSSDLATVSVALNGDAAKDFSIVTDAADPTTFSILNAEGEEVGTLKATAGSIEGTVTVMASEVKGQYRKDELVTFYDKDGNAVSANALSNYFGVNADGEACLNSDAGQLYDEVGNKLDMDTIRTDADKYVAVNNDQVAALNIKFQVGADSSRSNKISVNIEAMSAKGLGINGLKINGSTSSNADAAVNTISEAIQKVSTQRSALGAVQNRLEHTINNLDNVVENTTAAESQIRDTDMATEMVKYSNANILSQAGQSMLAQANQSNQGVLSILG